MAIVKPGLLPRSSRPVLGGALFIVVLFACGSDPRTSSVGGQDGGEARETTGAGRGGGVGGRAGTAKDSGADASGVDAAISEPQLDAYADVKNPEMVKIDNLALTDCAVLTDGSMRCFQDILGARAYVIPAFRFGLPIKRGAAVNAHNASYCVILDDGSLHCWGKNQGGELGYGHTREVKVNEAGAVDVGGKVVEFASGYGHGCALLESGGVRCWGHFTSTDSGPVTGGELGYGNTRVIGDDEPPSAAGDVDIGGKAISVAVGFAFSCAVLESGSVRCWGATSSGTIGDDETPASVPPVPLGSKKAKRVFAGNKCACVVFEDGSLRCWGDNEFGRLGYATKSGYVGPNAAVTLGEVKVGGKVAQVALAPANTCALLEDGHVRCWGEGGARLGCPGCKDMIGDDETPATFGKEVDLGGKAIQLISDEDSSNICALMEDHTMRCWGYAVPGYGLGSGIDIGDDEAPGSLPPIPVTYDPSQPPGLPRAK